MLDAAWTILFRLRILPESCRTARLSEGSAVARHCGTSAFSTETTGEQAVTARMTAAEVAAPTAREATRAREIGGQATGMTSNLPVGAAAGFRPLLPAPLRRYERDKSVCLGQDL